MQVRVKGVEPPCNITTFCLQCQLFLKTLYNKIKTGIYCVVCLFEGQFKLFWWMILDQS